MDHSTIFTPEQSETSGVQEEAIKSAILLGGFAYFDDDFNLLRINALSRTKSAQKLAFSGPFKVPVAGVYDELYKLGRTQPIQASHFREAGFESQAWIRPREVICGEQIFKDHPNWSGSFVFFRENRTAVGYTVDATRYINPRGDIGVICDALSHIGEANFSNNSIEPLFEISAWKNYVSKMKNVDTAKLIEELDDKKTLLHKACHAIGAKFIDNLLSSSNEASNLSYQDSYGWTPLHYACRFSPSDHVLILLLTTIYPDAVLQPDHYNRCPLHIACDSHTSVEVAKILLGAETSTTNDTLYRKTQRFGFLPLHLACYKGLSKGVIKTLLDADKDGYTVVTKSNCEHLPLHLVLLKQLPASTVKMILNAVHKIKDAKYQENYDCGIYEYFEANIPLHLACWNNSPKEVVQLLLDKDTESITTTLCVEPNDPAISGLSKFDKHFSLDDAPYNWSTTSLGIQNEVETMPLHLAVKHGSIDVIRLLLDKEFSAKHCSVASSSLYKTDKRGRTPLHIACEYTTNPLIIQLLVEADTLKKTIQIDDGKGYRPLHYACEVQGTSTEVVKILCEAEERAVQRNQTLKNRIKKETRMKMKMKTRSALSGSKESDRTPLYLALKTGAPTEVVDILLQPENFTLEGIDEISMERLAKIVKKSANVQEKVIDILAKRENFSMLVIEFYADVVALVALLGGTLELSNGTVSRIYPSLLVFSCVVFLTRELLQIVSVGADYITDVWSWNEVLGIGLLMEVALVMFDKVCFIFNFLFAYHSYD